MRTIFITGVSSGLGHALARQLLDAGDRIFGVSRRVPEDLIAHDRFRFENVDLADHAAATAKIEALLADVATLDLVILNAGVLSEFGDMAETSLEHLRDVMEVNTWANKTVIETLLGRGRQVKQVVAISSGASVNGHRGWNGYSISKAALNMLTMLYAREYPETHFCALAPGIVDTDMQLKVSNTPADERFPALQRLRELRGTDAMPTADIAARNLLNKITLLPERVTSGEFADVRKPPLAE